MALLYTNSYKQPGSHNWTLSFTSGDISQILNDSTPLIVRLRNMLNKPPHDHPSKTNTLSPITTVEPNKITSQDGYWDESWCNQSQLLPEVFKQKSFSALHNLFHPGPPALTQFLRTWDYLSPQDKQL